MCFFVFFFFFCDWFSELLDLFENLFWLNYDLNSGGNCIFSIDWLIMFLRSALGGDLDLYGFLILFICSITLYYVFILLKEYFGVYSKDDIFFVNVSYFWLFITDELTPDWLLRLVTLLLFMTLLSDLWNKPSFC